MKVPVTLLTRFGTPTISGQTYRWEMEGGPSDDVWCWQPGWAHAWNRHTGESIPVAFGKGNTGTGYTAQGRTSLVSFPWPSEWTACTGDAALYLEDRGLTAEEIAAYTVSDTSRTHLAVFPIVEDGKLVGWQGRNVYGHKPKCVSGSAKDGWRPCHKLVWGLDRIFPGETVYVGEGIFCALMFSRGTATLGSALSDTQVIKILDRKPSEVVVLGQNKDDESVADTRAAMFRTFTDLEVAVDYPLLHMEDYGVMLSLRKDEDGSVVQD